MSVTVYSYFNVNQLATLMDGIAAITASATYLDIFKIIAMIGFIVFIAGMAIGKAQEPFEFFRWLIILILIHSILLIPKTDVVLVDRTGTSAVPVAPRSNVPIGLAFFASVTSHIGDALTRAFETVFALPNDLQFQKTGLMFGSTVLTDSLQTVPVSPAFRDDLTKFINNCTYYDILAGRIDQNAFSKTDDLWAMMSNTSNTHLTPISTQPAGSMICTDAYVDLNNRWPAETTSTMQTRGRMLNPGAVNNVVAGAMLDTQLASSYTKLTSISKTSTDMLRQNMAINAVRDSQMIAAQRLDSDSSAIIGAAQAQAEMTTNLNYITMARVAERAAPAIRNVVEIICYAVFPIVILLLVLAGEHAGKVFKGYVMSLVWIQLIPPLYAVLNFVMTSVSQTTLVGIASSTGAAAAVNLVNIGQLSQHGLSDMAIAGYMTLSLPVIAWALVKGGEIGGAALFGAVLSPASNSSSHVAGNLAAGNVSQGNVSLDSTSSNNVNSNHYDTAPTMNAGYSRVTSAAGTASMGSDGTFRFQGNQSSLGFGANFGQKIGNALSQEAAARQEVAARESDAATQMRTAALVERMGISQAYSDQHGTNNSQDASHGSRSGQSVTQLAQIAENVNRHLGLAANSKVGQQILGELTISGNLGTSGGKNVLSKILGGSIGVGDKTVTSAERSKALESAIGYARDELKSHNVTTDQALNSDFRSSEAYQWGKQNRTDSVKGEEAALTRAEQHTHNSDVAKSEAFSLSSQARTVSENWLHYSMNYEGYVANRLHQDGKMEAFNMLYQTNPEQAARLAAGYLAETNFDVMPTMRPVSANLGEVQAGSPALADKTVTSEGDRLTDRAFDSTQTAHDQNRNQVTRHGFQQHTIKNDLGPRVFAARNSTESVINRQGDAIVSRQEASTSQASQELSRTNQIAGVKGPIEEKPKPGSAADLQDKVHDNLFDRKSSSPPTRTNK